MAKQFRKNPILYQDDEMKSLGDTPRVNEEAAEWGFHETLVFLLCER